jgi:hypothetical protein
VVTRKAEAGVEAAAAEAAAGTAPAGEAADTRIRRGAAATRTNKILHTV